MVGGHELHAAVQRVGDHDAVASRLPMFASVIV